MCTILVNRLTLITNNQTYDSWLILVRFNLTFLQAKCGDLDQMANEIDVKIVDTSEEKVPVKIHIDSISLLCIMGTILYGRRPSSSNLI